MAISRRNRSGHMVSCEKHEKYQPKNIVPTMSAGLKSLRLAERLSVGKEKKKKSSRIMNHSNPSFDRKVARGQRGDALPAGVSSLPASMPLFLHALVSTNDTLHGHIWPCQPNPLVVNLERPEWPEKIRGDRALAGSGF